MLIVLLILAAIASSAQPIGDGVPFVRQVAEAARSAKAGEPRERWASHDGLFPSVNRLRDGTTLWSRLAYWTAKLRHRRGDACCHSKDSTLRCTLTRAEYAARPDLDIRNIPAYQLRPATRELCVDEASKAILWERFETMLEASAHHVATFTKIERDPEFSPDEFEIPLYAGRSPDRWLQLLGSLPVRFCTASFDSRLRQRPVFSQRWKLSGSRCQRDTAVRFNPLCSAFVRNRAGQPVFAGTIMGASALNSGFSPTSAFTAFSSS